MKHLTDDQIQEYLDGDKLQNMNQIIEHIQECEKCKFQLDAYQQLYKNISTKEEEFILSNNFAQKTISKIENKKDKNWSLIENILVAFAFIMSISLSIYFFDLIGILSYFKAIDFSFFTELGKKLINTFSPNYIYLITAIMITILIEILDRLKIHKSIKNLNH